MLWFFRRLIASLSLNISFYIALEVWAINMRLHCESLKYGSYFILGHDLKVLSRQSFNSLLQLSIAACSILSQQYLFLQHFILSRQGFLCHDKSFFGSLKLYPARFVVLSILCCNTLMCGCWNIYVVTLIIVVRHSFCTSSSNCVAT